MHLITIAMHAVAPGEPNGLPDAETNVLLFLSDGTSCEGYYDGDHPEEPGLPFFRDVEGDPLDRDVVIGWADMPSGRNGGAPEVHRAFEIADQAMFELLLSEGALHGNGADSTVIGFTNEKSTEVMALAEASEAMREAFDWLKDRGYVELDRDGNGEFVSVIRRPGEDA